MLNSNALFGLALLVGATIIGVHSWNNDYAKTDSGATLTRVAPTPRTACMADCLNHNLTDACVRGCAASHPVLDLDGVTPCPDQIAPLQVIAKKKPAVEEKSNIAKMEIAHHHKSKASHSYKSKPHKHHSNHAPGHHHGGHGHHGPQKIPSHGAPPHLTGPPPGCR